MTEPLEMKASKDVEITEIVYEGLKREWRLTLDADAIDAEVDSRLAQLQSSANLPGFRKGRAPIHILRQREGGRIRDETKARTIMDAARAQVRQEGPPVRNPQLKPVDDEDSLAYTLSFEKMPEIPDLDFNSATLIRYKVDPEKNYEAMVKFILEKLFGADARHEHLPVGDKASQDRITAKGDWLALTGTRKSKSHHQVLSHPIEIIAGQDLDSLPSDRTIGLKQGDAITFEAESTVTGMSGGETTAEHFTYDLEVLRVMPPLGLSGEISMFADMEEAERRTTYDHFLIMAIKSTDQFCKQLLEDQ
ncbi:MAG: trigger factor family protein, partial [Rhodobacteraceae bacterium]|nr:trigger factor family protein [Paracoccaceae bacterium]